MIDHKITNQEVIDILFNLFVFRCIAGYIRSDNDPEFTSKAIRKWLSRLRVKTLYLEPDSSLGNEYIEPFNEKMRDEVLNREIFANLQEAKVLIEQWRKEYNHGRTHNAQGYRLPVPEAILSLVTT